MPLCLVLIDLNYNRTDAAFNPYIAAEFLPNATSAEVAELASHYSSNPAAVSYYLAFTLATETNLLDFRDRHLIVVLTAL